MLYSTRCKNMDNVLSRFLLAILISLCLSDNTKKEINGVKIPLKAGNNKRWMPAFSQFMPRDMDNNMGYFDNGFAGGQASQTQEPIGSINANYNSQDQLGQVSSESMPYSDPGAAMTNEIGLPDNVNEAGGMQQEISREGFQQNIGNEVSAFMKQEPSNLDNPENYAQLEGLGDTFSSKLAESDLLGTNLQTINGGLLPKASTFIGSKNAGSTTTAAQLNAVAHSAPSYKEPSTLPSPLPSPTAESQPTAKVTLKQTSKPTTLTEESLKADTTAISLKPVAQTAGSEKSTEKAPSNETKDAQPSPATQSSTTDKQESVTDKQEATTDKQESATDKQESATLTEAKQDAPAETENKQGTTASAKPKENAEEKKVSPKKAEVKQTSNDSGHSETHSEATAKVSSKTEESDSKDDLASKHVKEDSRVKKKHKVHVIGSRRHNPVKTSETEESGDGEGSEEEESSEGKGSGSAQKGHKQGSDETESSEKKDQQDQRIQKLKERIKLQKSHKRKYKPLTGTERQMISAKLGGVEERESEDQAVAEENKQLGNFNLNNNMGVSQAQLSAIEGQLRAQGGNQAFPSAAIKQQLVSSLKQALLANVAAMIKNKAKSGGNTIEGPLQNIANQIYAKSQKTGDSEDEEGETTEQSKQTTSQERKPSSPQQTSQQTSQQASQQAPQQQQQQQDNGEENSPSTSEEQKEDSASAESDILEQNLMKVDKKKLVHALATLMKSQKNQAGVQLSQLFSQNTEKPGNVVQNVMKQKNESPRLESQDEQQTESNDDEGDDDDDGPEDSQLPGQQHRQSDKAKDSKQSDKSGKQQLTEEQKQALLQQLEQQQQLQEQTSAASDDKDQKESGGKQKEAQEEKQKAEQEEKQSAKVVENQKGSQEEAGADQGDDDDDDQNDQSPDDGKEEQTGSKQESNQPQDSQSQIAAELLQRIHNKVADLNKENGDSNKESAEEEESNNKEKENLNEKLMEEEGKKVKHGSKLKHNQRQQSDPYAQIGLEDPSNNDKLPHKSKAQAANKESDSEDDQKSQDHEEKIKESGAAKGQSQPVKSKEAAGDEKDDRDGTDNATPSQSQKEANNQESPSRGNAQLRQQALQQQLLQEQALQVQQQQELRNAEFQQLPLGHGRHHSNRHFPSIQKFIDAQGTNFAGKLLSKPRAGLSRGDLKNQVEDIYATIGSFDPNVRKKKHKIFKTNKD